MHKNCYYCWEPISVIDNATEVTGPFDRNEGWAHDDCASEAGERADERSISEFYGSSSPQTEREREEHERKAP